MNKYILAER